jgi:ABC-type transporter Mla subunit MlaD
VVARVATVLALVIAIVTIGWILFDGGGESYTVKARFQNASQVVRGGLVQIAGKRVGEIKELDLTPRAPSPRSASSAPPAPPAATST